MSFFEYWVLYSFDAVLQKLAAIEKKGDEIMALIDETLAAATAAKASTDALADVIVELATDIQFVVDQLAGLSGGASAAQVAEVKLKIEQVRDKAAQNLAAAAQAATVVTPTV